MGILFLRGGLGQERWGAVSGVPGGSGEEEVLRVVVRGVGVLAADRRAWAPRAQRRDAGGRARPGNRPRQQASG
jgi:hypothetical protein